MIFLLGVLGGAAALELGRLIKGGDRDEQVETLKRNEKALKQTLQVH
jgi:hypothetical protein